MKLVFKAILACCSVIATLSFFQDKPSPNFVSEIKAKLSATVKPQYQEIKTYKGYHAIGLAMYCDAFLKAPKLPYLSTLLVTFGNPIPCIEKRIAQGGLELVKVDLIDATCHRNKVCPAGAASPTNLKEIEKRSNSIFNLAKKYPQISWYVSPALEHDEKKADKVKQMMDAAQKGCPTCKVVNTPFSGARLDPLELHGTTNKAVAFSVSGDGASMFDGDNIKNDGNNFQHRTAGKVLRAAWFNELNLRCTGEKNFVTPLKRTEKPTQDLFKQAYRIMMSEEPPFPQTPKQCKSVRDIKSPEINKPNAEAYCNGQAKDSRGNKPLLIIKKAGKAGEQMKILNTNGKQVGCFKYYGTFESKGLYRWYVGSCSKQTPTRLMDQLGNEWGYAMDSKNNCIRFNSIRRQGVYR